ncbi:YchF/TatD family DNA exonuclease [candidate division WOR-3 bacterium]|uniref:YchF/TatD family DNA exonuclease n=1 Tax=candidate division WOR-3 bacterium TaxID=2052148 RepID=A0A9D5KBR3_UNCW3|nr:YchF/TatD family DNA exonuclease [candidate division WOR-3 bacterium]MBD3364836.1 YchF/TatD family DNA exonuclease [candidate division WOR-3 bacterium]
MFDTHTHLAHRAFRKDREQAFERALEAGVNMMLEISWDLRSAENALRFAETHEGVWAAVGIHPHDSRNTPKNYLQQIEYLSKHEKIKAVGEIGLDFYRDLSPRSVQRRIFAEQIELADELKLPIVIHCRDAMEELLPLVEERGYFWGVFHSVSADSNQAERIAELGFYLGINGTLTYNGKGTKGWLPKVPAERLLIETDCPYLAPEPHRRQRNEPAYVRYVCEALADVLETSSGDVEAMTEANGRKLFCV